MPGILLVALLRRYKNISPIIFNVKIAPYPLIQPYLIKTMLIIRGYKGSYQQMLMKIREDKRLWTQVTAGSRLLNSKVIYFSLIKIKFWNACKAFDLVLLQMHTPFLFSVRVVSTYICSVSLDHKIPLSIFEKFPLRLGTSKV